MKGDALINSHELTQPNNVAIVYRLVVQLNRKRDSKQTNKPGMIVFQESPCFYKLLIN